MMNAREAAFQTLTAYKRNGAWSEIFLSNLAEKEKMERRDTALAYAIALGVLQNRELCDYYISCYSTVKPKKMEDAVLNILRLSVYQLAFLDKIPPNAAVNEGVKLAKKHCPRASGFVNAVLRKLAANAGNLPDVPRKDSIAYLSLKYSHPEWFVKYCTERIGAEETEKLLKINNAVAPVFVQTNALLCNAETLKTELEADGCLCRAHPWLDGCFEIELPGSPNRLAAFRLGYMQIQDTAARLDVLALAPQPGDKIIDCCAAPGGKSFAAAMLMGGKGQIVSCDVYPQKIKEIEEGAKRLKIDIISAREADASVFAGEYEAAFDAVIADVPCSGMGIIRKKPEIRYKSAESIADLPYIQRKILENVCRYVKPGGKLLYSTCTVMKNENEDIIEDFLEKHPEFSPEAFELPQPIGRAESGMLTLWPQDFGTDGFFICVLRRRK